MKLKVIVTPNPFTSGLLVHIHAGFEVNTVMRLINSRGTVIRVASCTLKKGDNKIKVENLQRYAAGKYQLELKLLNGELIETIGLDKI